jgi:hypothetical protein
MTRSVCCTISVQSLVLLASSFPHLEHWELIPSAQAEAKIPCWQLVLDQKGTVHRISVRGTLYKESLEFITSQSISKPSNPRSLTSCTADEAKSCLPAAVARGPAKLTE